MWIRTDLEEADVQSRLLSLQSDATARFVVFRERDTRAQLPINRLRNLCIRQSTTSHYLVLDADMLPSDNLSDAFLSIPLTLRMRHENAFVVPAVFLNSALVGDCAELEGCLRR